MVYQMRLHLEPFEAIKAGTQVIETRLYDEKRQQIKVGDQIIFLKRPEESEKLMVEVIGLSIFKSFGDLFKAIDKQKFGYPENVTLEDQVSCMRKYYPEDEERKYGVVGIFIKTLNKQPLPLLEINKSNELGLLELANYYIIALLWRSNK